jgi:hypothetical protein
MVAITGFSKEEDKIDLTRIRLSGNRKHFIDIKDGARIERLGEYDEVNPIVRCGDSYFFRAKKDAQFFYVDAITGKIATEKFQNIDDIVKVQNKFIFLGFDGTKWFFTDIEKKRSCRVNTSVSEKRFMQMILFIYAFMIIASSGGLMRLPVRGFLKFLMRPDYLLKLTVIGIFLERP